MVGLGSRVVQSGFVTEGHVCGRREAEKRKREERREERRNKREQGTMTQPNAPTGAEDPTDPLPAFERAVAERPDDAKALVALANHYWLIGSGPEPVADLASRAIAADPDNRAAWHLWALAESDPRQRVTRWQQVTQRFPNDQLAKANLADNAASLAGAEHDYEAVDLAITTYEELLAFADRPEQRTALEKAIATLKGWRF